MVVRSTCKESHRPGTTFARRTFHDFGDQSEQRGVIARLQKRPPMYMMGNIKTLVVDPLRRAEVEQVHAQDLGEPGNRRYSFGQGGHERVVIGSGYVDDCQAPIAKLACRSESSASRKPASSVVNCSTTSDPRCSVSMCNHYPGPRRRRGGVRSPTIESPTAPPAWPTRLATTELLAGGFDRGTSSPRFRGLEPLVSAVSAWRVWEEREQLFSRRMWFT
jgi:hypothetical protein